MGHNTTKIIQITVHTDCEDSELELLNYLELATPSRNDYGELQDDYADKMAGSEGDPSEDPQATILIAKVEVIK